MASPANAAIASFKYKEPVNKINGVGPGNLATIELPPVNRIHAIYIKGTITRTQTAGGKVVPKPSDLIGQIQLKVAGKPQRTRLASELFGGQGLNARLDFKSAGTVMYFQGAATAAWPQGTPMTATVNGVTVGNAPVVLGSAADAAIQAVIAAAAAAPTTAVFTLPIQLAEPFRKEYVMTDAMALVQSLADGTNIGVVTVELALNGLAPVDGSAYTLSNHAIKAEWEYDKIQGAAGSPVYLSKEYRFIQQYAAAGDIEVGTQLYNRQNLQRISLLTTSDQITRVVVKRGSEILRDVTFDVNECDLLRKDFEASASLPNRFDIEFDDNDNPNSAPPLDPTTPISIVATLATANDATKNIVILASYYGSLD